MRKLRAIDDQETLDRKRLIRDVRPFPNRVAAVLRVPGVQLAGIFLPAGVMIFLPAWANPLLLLGLFFFSLRLVCVRGERLPFRMPLGLSGEDKGDPLPGRRGFARPSGIFFVGNALEKGAELWLKAKDALTHIMLFGTTGSGKTEALVSLSYNALVTGSGFFYIDPKAAPKYPSSS